MPAWSYMRADSKSVHLNNNMQAKLDAQQSLQSELGLHAGKDFTPEQSGDHHPPRHTGPAT